MIRSARPADAERLRAIERAAGQRFYEVSMPEVAHAEPLAVETLVAYAQAGRSWVAVDDRDRPLGYVVVDIVDGHAHVEQVSVDPDYQGRGLGRLLLDAVELWAAQQGMTALTLTTFSQVSWNRPLYEHLGFVALDEAELSPGLRAVRDTEADHGLDATDRVCTRRPITPPR